MPPDSSKKRSRTSVSCVGMTPSARRPVRQVRDRLLGGARRQAPFPSTSHAIASRTAGWILLERRSSLRSIARAQIADRLRQLVAPRRRFAEPERNGRRRALARRRRAPSPGADLQHPPRRVAQLEDVAGDALDGEVLVQRADERVVGIEDHAIVGDLGNRAAGGHAPSSRAPRRPRSTALTSSRWTSAARRPRRVAKPSAAIATTASKSLRVEIAVRPGAAHQREQLVLADTRRRPSRRRSAAPARRAARRAATIASRSPRRTERSSAAHSIRSSREVGNSRPLGMPAIVCPDRPDALEQRRDPVRRSDLADEIDVADVDAQLERRRRDERLERARFQPRLRVEALLLREAPVMRRHGLVAEPVAQVTRQALGHPPRVHEDERRPVCGDQRRQPVVVLLPDLVRHHRFERRAAGFRGRGPSPGDAPRRRSRRHHRTCRPRNRATSSIGFCVAERPIRSSRHVGDTAAAARARARGARRAGCRSRRGFRRR